ncbi:tubulin-specific chaperone D [Thecamonas trahens ATCC 50062]|uniref:Tubulin-specific chaperone D n=1 Tax=Thecamonas trahens ATCC 50062 TaxID=461836 RepID=A0A0L0D331_THETB|nr:tubulin-specific chaperone D [Thecamonas trahens ATCC 50062]KNC46719.1 tubulin-specific chaperone D [Thecamonas trahens ATCC 50062]|eukprot:XP_013760481.1 tubulin-specific chaperone D [Thecamonas trahens ATCC 50062]
MQNKELDKYLEQPQLLDPHLGSLLPPLFVSLEEALAGAGRNDGAALADAEHVQAALFIIYCFAKVRGVATVARFFPHAPKDVEPVLALLHGLDPTDPDRWAARYVCLLWASIVIMVPFGLESIDSHGSLVDDLLALAKTYLADASRASEAAALLVAAMLARRDLVTNYLAAFVGWAMSKLQSADGHGQSVPGVLLALIETFKRGARADLLPLVGQVLPLALSIASSASSMLVRDRSVRLVERLGLTYLKPTVPAWRYQRGGRAAVAAALAGKAARAESPSAAAAAGDIGTNSYSDSEYESDDDDEVDENIDPIVHVLLQGLSARENNVRWSAAAGLGRICERLPSEFAAEVVDNIVGLLSPVQPETAWHGACLALAELARRGLLLPGHLSVVVKRVLEALAYDVMIGTRAVGANIRDAACYVCWAFARAYDAAVLQPVSLSLAQGLVVTALTDREVNCRRAGAAALQELVGRLGGRAIPHGIEIITTLSRFVASYAEYAEAVFVTLMSKTSHWDAGIRSLAAKALASIFDLVSEQILTTAVPQWLEAARARAVSIRHGALLALGHVLHAAAVDGLDGACDVSALVALIPEYDAARKFKGVAGVLTRKGMLELVSLVSSAGLALSDDDRAIVLEFVLASFRAPEAVEDAKAALSAFGQVHLMAEDGELSLARVAERVARSARTNPEPIASAFVGALGALPYASSDARGGANSPLWAPLGVLLDLMQSGAPPARREATKSLVTLVVTTELVAAALSGDEVAIEYGRQTVSALVGALDDYTRTEDGDVGSWVRMEAMRGVAAVAEAVAAGASHGAAFPNSAWNEAVAGRAVARIARQALEKIDRVRELATATLFRIVAMDVPCMVWADEFASGVALAGEDASFGVLVPLLLGEPTLCREAMSGLVVSVGDLAQSVAHEASRALLGMARGSDSAAQRVVELLLATLRGHSGDSRVVVPTLKTLDALFAAGVMETQASAAGELLGAVQTELRGSRDVHKLMAGAKVLGSMLMYGRQVAVGALKVLLSFLAHPYAKLRKHTADELYLALNTYEDHMPDDEDEADDLLDLLSDFAWDGDRSAAAAARDPLFEGLGVPKPAPRKVTGGGKAKASSGQAGAAGASAGAAPTGGYADLGKPSQQRRLARFEEVPTWMQDNKYIRSGYRVDYSLAECTWSMVERHNEVANIWSHLVGVPVFVALVVWVLSGRAELASEAWLEQAPFLVFVCGCGAAYTASVVFHTFLCHSHAALIMCSRLDYSGIVLIIMTSIMPGVYYGYHCSPGLQQLYTLSNLVLGSVTVVALQFSILYTKPWRRFRTLLFAAFASSGVVPAVHALFELPMVPHVSVSLLWLVVMYGLLGLGAVVYFYRIPERWWPGRFDLLGASHNWWHVFSLSSSFVHAYNVYHMYLARTTLPCEEARALPSMAQVAWSKMMG